MSSTYCALFVLSMQEYINLTHFANTIFIDFSFFIGLDFYLLQIQIYCCKVNVRCSETLIIFFYFAKYTSFRKMCDINVVDLNKICILCHFTTLYVEPFLI
jgi:hypothetical protein